MEPQAPSDDHFVLQETTDDPCNTSASHRGGIFADAQHFTVVGGTFTNVTNTYAPAPSVPPSFRMISMGDIDLRAELHHQLRFDADSGVVGRPGRRGWFRRVYSARVDGRTFDLTAAIYEGHGAEKDWREEMEKYAAVRHPNIIQLYGGSSAGSMHALLFHGDLVPYDHFLQLYRHSPILTVYIYAYAHAQLMAVDDYLYSSYEHWLDPLRCLLWIRRSSGLLSIDFGSDFSSDAGNHIDGPPIRYASTATGMISSRHSITSLNALDKELLAIEWLSLEQFHEICFLDLSQVRAISGDMAPASATIKLGAIIVTSSPAQGAAVLRQYIETSDVDQAAPWPECGYRMDDGRVRFESHRISNTVLDLDFWAPRPEAWLSQANFIFKRLQLTAQADLESYALVDCVQFHLTIPPIAEDAPAGYLFARPQQDLRCSPGSLERPDRLAYWSLLPSGLHPLSTAEAERLGFPPFHLTREIWLRSWGASIYAGLRKFHAAKGFDPDSQDMARHLGYPLYELPSDLNFTVIHGDLPDNEGPGSEIIRASKGPSHG